VNEIEGKIAFVPDRPLRGPGVTVAHVLAAARGVVPALEIIAGRLALSTHRPVGSGVRASVEALRGRG